VYGYRAHSLRADLVKTYEGTFFSKNEQIPSSDCRFQGDVWKVHLEIFFSKWLLLRTPIRNEKHFINSSKAVPNEQDPPIM
jgi:hypothetical protein